MKNRMKAMFIALVMAFGFIVFSPVSANAYSGTKCANYNYNQIRTCVTATWIREGNYIILTSYGHTTPVGCNRLQATKYPDRYAEFPGVSLYPGGSNACTATVGTYRKSTIQNASQLFYAAMANINNDFDHGVHWDLRLHLNGDMTLVDYYCNPCNGTNGGD